MPNLFYFQGMETSKPYPAPRSIKNWAVEDRPREKFMSKGRESLSDAELLAILLCNGYQDTTALDLARELLQLCEHDLGKLASLQISEIEKIKGIGKAKALTIAAALELGRRKRELIGPKKIILNSSKIIFEHHRYLFEDLQHEEFYILMLNRACKMIAIKRVSVGGITATTVDPRKVLREIILHQASFVVLMHNHPSGNLNPSDPDRALTARIVKLCRLLDSAVIDHLIFTNTSYYSFADHAESCLQAA
jgi:DNA repair protein RadC